MRHSAISAEVEKIFFIGRMIFLTKNYLLTSWKKLRVAIARIIPLYTCTGVRVKAITNIKNQHKSAHGLADFLIEWPSITGDRLRMR
jgi:hypothetical protein